MPKPTGSDSGIPKLLRSFHPTQNKHVLTLIKTKFAKQTVSSSSCYTVSGMVWNREAERPVSGAQEL